MVNEKIKYEEKISSMISQLQTIYNVTTKTGVPFEKTTNDPLYNWDTWANKWLNNIDRSNESATDAMYQATEMIHRFSLIAESIAFAAACISGEKTYILNDALTIAETKLKYYSK